MQKTRHNRRIHFVLIVILACGFVLACRTADLITSAQATRPTATQRHATSMPTRLNLAQKHPTKSPTVEPTEVIPTEALLPIEPPPPTEPPPPPSPPPTHAPAPTRKPLPSATPSPSGPTVTPAPTRCPQQYCAVYRGCQTEVGNTIIEGFVYNNGVPQDGVAVRVASGQGEAGVTEDFVSGTDPVNRGKPDKLHPGHYILQIVAGESREGNWWVFLMDKKNGTIQISEGQLIHTNDDPYNPANCQHAFVDFVR
ncbi:MAG TPA: hypothetical protein VFD70_06165 [Anaerolineae bacterium]|nr:hypothetical protein [Anaerolineae bacterium]